MALGGVRGRRGPHTTRSPIHSVTWSPWHPDEPRGDQAILIPEGKQGNRKQEALGRGARWAMVQELGLQVHTPRPQCAFGRRGLCGRHNSRSRRRAALKFLPCVALVQGG